ncbi:MAG: site-specific integrase [Rikenellaceae bacterium]
MSNELKLGFYLRHKEIKSDGTVPIMGRITIGRTMVQFSAKCSVAERLWDTKSARAVGKSKVATELNRTLDKISLAIHTHYKELVKRKASATATEVKNAFQGIASGQESLLQFCERYYDKLGERVGVTLSYNGRYAYRNLTNNLRQFLKAKYNLSDMPFSALDLSFAENFDFFLRVDKKLKPNSVVSAISYLKFIIYRAVDEDLLPKNPFADYYPEGEKLPPKSITKEELAKIMTTPLDTPSRYLVRDLFLFSVFTGISYIDIKNLTTRHLSQAKDGVWWIHSKRQKTGNEFHVPLLDVPMQIIERYRGTADGDHLFRVFSGVTMNIQLKKITKMCGIERDITYHQGRHSYASLITLSQGVPMESVSKMLGHSSIKSTHIYAKMSNDKIDNDMRILERQIKGKYQLANL